MAGSHIFVFLALPKLAACSRALAVVFLYQDICYSSASRLNSLFIHSIPWLDFGALTGMTRPAGQRLSHSGNTPLMSPFIELLCPTLVIGHPKQMYPERSSLPHRSKLFWATFLFNILLDAES